MSWKQFGVVANTFLWLLIQQKFVLGQVLLPEGKVTIHVIDEEGHPIKGANIGIGFYVPSKEGLGADEIAVNGISDESGLFSGTAHTTGQVGASASKDGYYATYSSLYIFKNLNQSCK